jgi:dipeptidyl aminopeptidase/acylaminoacyl peptidase
MDWYILGEDLKLHNLTQNLRSQPGARVIDDPAERSMLVESGGELWRIAPGSEPESVSQARVPKITGIQWVSSERSGKRPGDQLKMILSTGSGVNSELYLFEPDSGISTQLKKPAADARVLYFSDQGKVAIFTQSTNKGSVTTVSGTTSGVSRELFHDNGKGPLVAKAPVQIIEYRSTDGKSLKGLLMLPYGYEKGKRYPLIVDEYPGHVVTSAEPDLGALAGPAEGGLLFSAHGYAVLRPSMPLPPTPGTNDNYLELTKGVLPAIDRAIELGIADPERVGVFGHSYGGFGAYGLIEQTDRFKAAVAYAAPSDFVSAYGSFDAQLRYSSDPELFYQLLNIEVGQSAMGSPPWKDPERYVRNSPLFHVDSIHTPLLIIHGDMDRAVPIEQSEEFYTALHRLNKPVRFLRYWGEGHLLTSPANRVDLWKQLYAWFDEFLMKPEKPVGSAP